MCIFQKLYKFQNKLNEGVLLDDNLKENTYNTWASLISGY